MGRHALNMVLDPCVSFRVERARDGRVSLLVNPVSSDEPPYRMNLREGETWIYSLTLNADGFGQGNRVERNDPQLPPAPEPERKGIAGHFRRHS